MHRWNKWTRSLSAIAVLCALGMGTVSCAGGPSAAAETAPRAPAWTMEVPAPRDGYTFFVGYADGPAGGEVQALEAATASLISEIMRYIGVTIRADSTATARSTLDSFQADLVQTVKQTSTSRVSGFQISERFVVNRANAVTVYLLGRYSTRDLETEKRRIAAVFQERMDAVAVPEAEGKALLEDGDAVGAARRFIAAAAAAAGSDGENAAIQFERNINNAKNALSRITLTKLNDRLEAFPGAPFPAPFRARLNSGPRPLSGASVIVGHQARLPNGRMTTRTATVLTGQDGVASFDHPFPDFVGRGTLTMRLDLSSAVEPLFGISDRYASLVASLEDEISGKRVSFEYTVVSRARSIPMAVAVVDVDASGGLSVGTTSSALLQTLSAAGFRVSAAPLEAELVSGKDDAALLAAAKSALAGRAERLAYGTTRIVSVRDDRDQRIATVSAEIKVVELATGTILYSSVKQVPAIASSEREAVEAARRQLGQRSIGEEMAAQLP